MTVEDKNDIADFVKLLRSTNADDLLMRAARIIEWQTRRIEELEASK